MCDERILLSEGHYTDTCPRGRHPVGTTLGASVFGPWWIMVTAHIDVCQAADHFYNTHC